jgi:hypothetical protein
LWAEVPSDSNFLRTVQNSIQSAIVRTMTGGVGRWRAPLDP